MRLLSQKHTYQHDWETVTSAFWEKYPNKFQPHVIRIDTLNRHIDTISGNYKCQRLHSLLYNVPSWIQTILHVSPYGYGIEEAEVDRQKKLLTIKSSNITLSRLLGVVEVCEYSPHPEEPDKWTLYSQRAEYKIKGLGYVTSALEKAIVQTASDKAKSGLEAMQSVIHKLESENWRNQYADKVKKTLETIETKLVDSREHLEKKVAEAKSHVIQKFCGGTPAKTTETKDKPE